MLLTSGPTREPLDPVRYLSNYSTGTMGRSVAQAVQQRGHRLTWVRCPEDAETARQLLARLRRELPRHDVLVMAAAVCDVRPAELKAVKIKKDQLTSIRVTPNPDVIRELSRRKKPDQVFVGFALESDQLRRRALEKMSRKRMDVILVQQVTKKKTPFGDQRIDAEAIEASGLTRRFQGSDKRQIARYLVRRAEALAAEKYA